MSLFSNYGVLSERELESRYEVFLEQYVTKLNIESETAASIARTMLLPAAARHLALLLEAQLTELAGESSELIDEFATAIKGLEAANLAENQPHGDVLEHAEYMRDKVIPAMERGARSRGQAREDRGRRSVAAAEVLGDPVHQVAQEFRAASRGPDRPCLLHGASPRLHGAARETATCGSVRVLRYGDLPYEGRPRHPRLSGT